MANAHTFHDPIGQSHETLHCRIVFATFSCWVRALNSAIGDLCTEPVNIVPRNWMEEFEKINNCHMAPVAQYMPTEIKLINEMLTQLAPPNDHHSTHALS